MSGPFAKPVPAEVLREFDRQLWYDRDRGIFYWMTWSRGHCWGQRADRRGHRGYRVLKINGIDYRAHRVAWYFVHNKLPDDCIDHINGDPGDNRIANLRDVSHRLNMQNKRRPHMNNRLGVLGVQLRDGKFWAAIGIGAGRRLVRGPFATAERAYEAYVALKRQHHEGCTLVPNGEKKFAACVGQRQEALRPATAVHP